MPADVITFEEYTGQAEGALTNNHSPSLNSVKHPSGIYSQTSISLLSLFIVEHKSDTISLLIDLPMFNTA